MTKNTGTYTLNRQPTLFILVKIVLLINMISAGFFTVLLAGSILFSAFSHSFQKSEVVLDVRKVEAYKTSEPLPDSLVYKFRPSKNGDLAVMMPWYSHLFLPLGFINIHGFEFSLSYWIFYGILCFLFYRIISSVSFESPFSNKNIRRIFWIGYTLILYDVFVLIRYVIISIFVEKTTGDVFRYDGLGPMVYYKVGILVIILAMIYRRGVVIQREQELTV